MKNTLFDSNLGDVESINIPIGQSTPYAGNFTSVTVTGAISAGSLSVTTPITHGINPSVTAGTTLTFTGAVSITSPVNVVVAATYTSGSAVALPTVASWIGADYIIFNQTTHTVAVFPQPNDIIDVTVTGAPVLLDAGKRCQFWGVSTTAIISAQLGTTSV
jgi:hypothetical protein